ncbi:MAG: BtrH N-terminal domain-containing protein, partial [Acidobacteria bacterium]|nr:BtrH N-terminal domain-containing protein [Acidobacteriota bacterium]
MKLEAYRYFGGKHAETAAVKNILAFLGVEAPHTGEAFTEEMLLGIGGGIGAGYFVISYGDVPGMAIGTRHLWYDSPKFVTGLCDRIGARTVTEETTSPKLAARILRETIEGGSPAMIYLDLACLPYTGLPAEFKKGGYHVAVVFDQNEERDEAHLGDLSRHALTVTTKQLEEARRSITSYKHRLVILQPPKKPIDLEKALRDGIRACCDGLLHARIKNFSLESIRKWGTLVGDVKAKDGWTKSFKPGRPLYRGLTWTYRFIELSGTGGSGMRGMYADFLDEARRVIGKPALKEVAARYCECGRLWSEIGRTALPDRIPPLRETRELLDKQHRIFVERGHAAVPEIRRIGLR